jgi:hypothetical protein
MPIDHKTTSQEQTMTAAKQQDPQDLTTLKTSAIRFPDDDDEKAKPRFAWTVFDPAGKTVAHEIAKSPWSAGKAAQGSARRAIVAARRAALDAAKAKAAAKAAKAAAKVEEA